MKMFIALLLSYSALSFGAGGVNGGGSDHLPSDHGAAWFLEGIPARTIKVCFQKDEVKFPVSDEAILESFNYAMNQWANYIAEKKVNDVEQDDEDDLKPIFYQLVTKYEVIPKCGKEDLAIYLGYSNKEIEEIRSKLFDPFALAHKISYDHEKGWARGFIWLRGVEDDTNEHPFIWDKNQFLNLKGILTHELGHVFGNDHRDGTIMGSMFAESLVEYEIPEGSFHWHLFKFAMTHIDWGEELVQCLNCQLVHEGGMLWLPGSRAEMETYKFLSGSQPKGTVVSKVEIIPTNDKQLDGVYSVTDGTRTINYPIHLLINSVNFTYGDSAVFKRSLSATVVEGEWTSTQTFEKSSNFAILNLMGWMEKDGVNIPLILEGKSSTYEAMTKYPEDARPRSIIEKTYPYRLIALDGKERHILFTKLQEVKFSDEDGEPEETKHSLNKFLKK